MTDRPDVDLANGAFYGGDPHPVWAWMRRHEPVYRDRNGLWGITRYADLKAVSCDPATFSSAGGIRPDAPPLPMMIDMDDPQHKDRRKLVNRGFTPRRVAESEDRIRRICDEIIDAVCEKGECDFVKDIAAPLPMIVIGDMLGVAPADRDELLRWSDDMLKALGSGEPGAMDRATQSFIDYSDYIGAVISDRRRTGSADDLVGVLVQAEVEASRLADDELVHETLLILIGGDETTRHVISGGMYELLRHPDQQARLRDDPALLPTAVEEMLRWVSPIKNMARTVTGDTELGGCRLEEGDKLLLLYPSANRDDEVFDEPDRFDITRQPNEHVAFGFGPHFCLGNALARVELRVMFERLLARLPDLALADGSDPPLRPANFISGIESMPVTFTPAAPVAS